LIVVTAALLLPATAGTADEISAGGGADRCASYTGNVSGGTAFVSICLEPGAGVSAEVPGVPSPGAGASWYGCIRVTRTTTHQVCGIPAAPVPLVMDPAMQAGVIDFSLTGGGGTLTAKITLTATMAAPSPGQYLDVYCFEYNASVEFCGAGAGAGVSRPASGTGTISSSLKGGGAVSGGAGSMSQSGGGGAGYYSF
jgi:hypothetical protein